MKHWFPGPRCSRNSRRDITSRALRGIAAAYLAASVKVAAVAVVGAEIYVQVVRGSIWTGCEVSGGYPFGADLHFFG
jgi:hypothetical protein